MVSKSCLAHLRRLIRGNDGPASIPHQFNHQPRRSMASIANLPLEQIAQASSSTYTASTPSTITTSTNALSPPNPKTHITTTIYDFPTMEPLRFAYYPTNHLYLPLRKDILHRAVIYEGDMTRSGTAHTKWRDDVHGSHKKLYQQKGTGRARVGDKQSPIRRGGGVAFGPKARDFSTRLPRKIYDLAWRTALSYRYRRGQLIVVERIDNTKETESWWLKQIFEANRWGTKFGRSLLIPRKKREGNERLFMGMENVGEQGRILALEDVDVKDLLEMGRVVIEQRALNDMLKDHSSDLAPAVGMVTSAEPVIGTIV